LHNLLSTLLAKYFALFSSTLNHVEIDTDTQVPSYGISLILPNVGMYVGIPAIVVVGIGKKF
jgi:hypothetical protein